MFEMVDDVKITMSKNDSLDLPHVHASYGIYHGIFSLKTGKVINGNIPAEKVSRIETWIVLNDQRLIAQWNRLT